MNKDNAKDYLPLVQALADGKVIQFCNGVGDWQDINGRLDFLMPPANYRIKPEPKEFWTYIAPDGSESQAYPNKESVRIAAGAAHRDDPLSRGIFITHYREVIE